MKKNNEWQLNNEIEEKVHKAYKRIYKETKD